MITSLSLLLIFLFFNRQAVLSTLKLEKKSLRIVIDPGHGGIDPGKVGLHNTLEKDINLSIALHLKKFLEADDRIVFLTRTEDVGLHEQNASNKKMSDLNNRIQLIINEKADLMVSIHQNAYVSEKPRGAQVFYHGKDKNAELLAKEIQAALTNFDPENKREAKTNSTYYLFKNSPVPTVIVECGFLSNYNEAALLADPYYQEKVAFSIAMGISSYCNQYAE